MTAIGNLPQAPATGNSTTPARRPSTMQVALPPVHGWKHKGLALLAVGSPLMVTTAGTQAQATKPAPPTPIDAKKAELGGKTWDPAWDQIVEKAIPAEMLSSQVPHGVRRFCPNFYHMNDTDKRVFWAYFNRAQGVLPLA